MLQASLNMDQISRLCAVVLFSVAFPNKLENDWYLPIFLKKNYESQPDGKCSVDIVDVQTALPWWRL